MLKFFFLKLETNYKNKYLILFTNKTLKNIINNFSIFDFEVIYIIYGKKRNLLIFVNYF